MSASIHRLRRSGLIGIVALAGCHDAGAPGYIVTTRPLDLGVGTGICVAVDRRDQHGVWWWEPGVSGCSTRSTGPDVFPADAASVTSGAGESSDVSFRIQTQSRTNPFVGVRLVVTEREIRVVSSGARVSAHVRRDLRLPETGPMRRL
ncbi:MAG TPA: hypothetical protein VNR90_06615 [Vicinamibacterales bacterium]|nr:hypothetical protein [Vicinamibacterales bacterium]